MLEILQKLQLKLHENIRIFVIFLFVGFTAQAEPCEQCNQLHANLAKEMKLKESYVALKAKNEEYLKKPNVPSGAIIKVTSNLVVINIKLETQENKIEALRLEKKKLNDCSQCPISETKKS